MKGLWNIKAVEIESVHFAAKKHGFLRPIVGGKLSVNNQYKGYYHEQ
jgi:hypothetical protein